MTKNERQIIIECYEDIKKAWTQMKRVLNQTYRHIDPQISSNGIQASISIEKAMERMSSLYEKARDKKNGG